jgi:hypothetical protein
MIGETQLRPPGAAIDAGIAVKIDRGDADDGQRRRLIIWPTSNVQFGVMSHSP